MFLSYLGTKKIKRLIFEFEEKRRVFTRERQLRLQAEQRRDEIARKLIEYQQQMKDIHETLVNIFV